MLHRLGLLLSLVLVLAACGDATPTAEPTPDTQTPTPAQTTPEADAALGEGLTVATTVWPLAAIASEIAPGAEVELLTAAGQDPHDLELSPGDRRLIETADLVLYMGDIDFQPQVEAAVADATGRVLAVAEIARDHLRDFDGHAHDEDDDYGHEDEGDDHGHDEDDGHGHEDEADDDHGHEEGGDDHAHGDDAVDPHIWFDAEAMAEVAEEIGDALSALGSDNAEALRAAGEALHDELLALDAELDALLSGCTHDTAIVSHEAYAYLLEARGLEQVGISGAGGHGDASPQRLAELTERIRDEGIRAVLAEPVEGRADAEALAAEAGVELLEIDPLEIGHGDLADERFGDALRAQAQMFAEALECSGG